jgi:adenosylcobinamide-phosphate synthase
LRHEFFRHPVRAADRAGASAGAHNPIHAGCAPGHGQVSRNFDAGKTHHGWVAWGLAVLVPSLATLGIYWLLVWTVGWPFAVLWSVAMLYVTLGFRQFSHHFTGSAMRWMGRRSPRARAAGAVAAGGCQRAAAQRGRASRHRVFRAGRAPPCVWGAGWFSVLAALGLGPSGAVLYRMSEFVGRYWKYRSKAKQQPASAALQGAAARAWRAIDWLPARATALGFAVVGSFEEAIDSWRNYSQRFPDDNDGVVLAATSGAINVAWVARP